MFINWDSCFFQSLGANPLIISGFLHSFFLIKLPKAHFRWMTVVYTFLSFYFSYFWGFCCFGSCNPSRFFSWSCFVDLCPKMNQRKKMAQWLIFPEEDAYLKTRAVQFDNCRKSTPRKFRSRKLHTKKRNLVFLNRTSIPKRRLIHQSRLHKEYLQTDERDYADDNQENELFSWLDSDDSGFLSWWDSEDDDIGFFDWVWDD